MSFRHAVLTILVLAIAIAPVAAAKQVDDARVTELETRIESLESQIAALQSKMAEIEDFAMRDQRANEAFAELTRLYNQGDHVAAKAALDDFQAKYAGTDAAKRAARIARELAVIGKPAPASVVATQWYSGENPASLDIASGTTLVVFFEEWCPHCKREVPKMKETWEKYGDRGLNLLAATKVTKSATDEKVQSFVDSNGLVFPVFKENGELSRYFNVSGIPAAAVVKDGKIVWRGHPANLTDQMLDAWL
jgi:thiol-disulfide isomerase/thioredoxin